MKQNNRSRMAPYIRASESNRSIMGDVVLVLLFDYLMAYYYYGARVLMLGGISVVTAVALDWLCCSLAHRRIGLRDFSPVVTGLLLPLMMPATVPYLVVAAAAAFAIVVVKQPFGGVGRNPFNPAAGGLAFVTVCFPGQMFLYPEPFSNPSVFGESAVNLMQNPSYSLDIGGLPSTDPMEMLLGNFAGPMGATNILVVIACLIYLVFRNTVRWQLPVSFLATVSAWAFLFPRAAVLSRGQSVVYELCSGILLFAAVFLINDPVTSPKRDSTKVVYGILAGCVTMLYRWFGGFEEGVAFAILLMNALAPVLDQQNERIHSLIRRRRFETASDQEQ